MFRVVINSTVVMHVRDNARCDRAISHLSHSPLTKQMVAIVREISHQNSLIYRTYEGIDPSGDYVSADGMVRTHVLHARCVLVGGVRRKVVQDVSIHVHAQLPIHYFIT